MSIKNERNTKTIIYWLFFMMCVLLVFSIFENASAKEITTTDNRNNTFTFIVPDSGYEYLLLGKYGTHPTAGANTSFNFYMSNDDVRVRLSNGLYSAYPRTTCYLGSSNTIYTSNGTYEYDFTNLTSTYCSWYSATTTGDTLFYSYSTKDYYDYYTNDLLFEMSIPPAPSIDFTGQYNENNTLYELTINYQYSTEFNQYSVDNGKTWVNVSSASSTLNFTSNQLVLARIIKSNGELVTSSTMNIDNIDTSNSLITFDIKYTTSRTSANLTIDFGSYVGGYREYSIDNGTTWNYTQNRTIDISVTRNMIVFARIKDTLGNFVTSATYNIGDIVSQNPFYTDVEEGDENFNLFQTILSEFNKKFPIVYEIGDFFNIFIDYQPISYTSDYTPFDDIHLYIPAIGLDLTVPIKIYYFWEYRETIFTLTKLSFLIIFILKLWHEFQQKVGGDKK